MVDKKILELSKQLLQKPCNTINCTFQTSMMLHRVDGKRKFDDQYYGSIALTSALILTRAVYRTGETC
jgi:hypothetical protein